MRARINALVWLGILLLFGPPASATDRVALVVGEADYANLVKLNNPVVDAKAVAAALKSRNFEVFENYDLPRAELLDAIENFKSKAAHAQVALIYYAGHGLELGGKNVLAPRDMEIDCENSAPKRAIDLDQFFDAVSGAPNQIVLLDACRNDPFPQCKRAIGSGSGFRGFSRVNTQGQSLLIANSTLSGKLAADGPAGDHSPFASALLAHFATHQSAYLRDLLDSVAADVAKQSGGAQIPEILTRGGAPRVCLDELSCGQVAALTPPSVANPVVVGPVPDLATLGIREKYVDYVSALAFAPGGDLLATASGRGVQIWNARSGRLERNFDVPASSLALAFSKDGKQIAMGGNDEAANIRDVTTGAVIKKFENLGFIPRDIKFSPAAPALAIRSDDSIVIVDIDSGKMTHLDFPAAALNSIAYSPDGTLLLAGYGDNTAKFWSVANRKIVGVLKGQRAWVNGTAFSADGETAFSSSDDETIRVWNVEDRKMIRELGKRVKAPIANGNQAPAFFSDDGSYVLQQLGDNALLLWETASSRATPIKSLITAGVEPGLELTDNDKPVLGQTEFVRRTREQFTGTPTSDTDPVVRMPSCVAVSHERRAFAIGDYYGGIRLFDLESQALIMTIFSLGGDDFVSVVHDKGYVASEGAQNKLVIIEGRNARLVDQAFEQRWLKTDLTSAINAQR